MSDPRESSDTSSVPSRLRFAAMYGTMRVLKFVGRGMSGVERRWLAHKIMEHRETASTTTLAGIFQDCLLAWKNVSHDIEYNGEVALLRRLAPFSPANVFDVGANVGDWSEAALRLLPTAKVHAFEIVPDTCRILTAHLANLADRAAINSFGLGDIEGDVTVFTRPAFSERASMVREALDMGLAGQPPTIRGSIKTGDSYITGTGIRGVDILKIDVEGNELAVLKGFSTALEAGAIDVIQFEYGGINLVTRQYLQDFYSLLEKYDFALGKLWPEGVAFMPYSYAIEDFQGPNYVACRRARADIMAAIARPTA